MDFSDEVLEGGGGNRGEVWRLYTLPNHIFSIQSASACPANTRRSNEKPLFFSGRTKSGNGDGMERKDRLVSRKDEDKTRGTNSRESEGDGTKGWPIPLSGWSHEILPVIPDQPTRIRGCSLPLIIVPDMS